MERWHSSVMMKSKVSMGISGLYSTVPGCGLTREMSNPESSSFSGSRSSPRSRSTPAGWWRGTPCLLNRHGPTAELDVVQFCELPCSSGVSKPGTREGLATQVVAVHQEQYPPGAGILDQRYTGCRRKVLPLPVAIWISALGFASASDSSRLRIAHSAPARARRNPAAACR